MYELIGHWFGRVRDLWGLSPSDRRSPTSLFLIAVPVPPPPVQRVSRRRTATVLAGEAHAPARPFATVVAR